MEQKRVNSIFTSIILFSIAGELIISFFLYDVIDLGNLLINEGIVESFLLIPAVIGLLVYRDKSQTIGERLRLNSLRPKTVFAVILYGIVIIPIGTFANAISLLFTENIVTESSSLYLEQNFVTVMLFVAVIGPLVEEFVFRGVIYNGYRKAGGRIGAILLSSLLFGLMHMNLNQLVYAFVVGILLAVVVEAADSLWASALCHFIFNAQNVVSMFLSEKLSAGVEELDYSYTKDELLELIIVYAFVAVIAIVIALLLLKWISKLQDSRLKMRELITEYEPGEKPKLLTPVLWVGIAISLLYIALWEIIKYL